MEANSAKDLSLPTTDPVCGMCIDVIVEEMALRTHEGRTYVFCSADCAMKFDADGAAYIAAIRVLGKRHGRARSAAEEEQILRNWLDAPDLSSGGDRSDSH